jgi:hypothetical protein
MEKNLRRVVVTLVGAVALLGSGVGAGSVAAAPSENDRCPDGYIPLSTSVFNPTDHRALNADRDKDGVICAKTSNGIKGPFYRDF